MLEIGRYGIMKKKIVFFARDLNIGGIEKSLINLINNLVEFYDITLVLENDEGDLKIDLSNKVKIVEYKVSSIKFVPLRKLINYMRRLNFIKKHKNKYAFSCAYATYLYSASVLSRAVSKNSCLFVHNDYSQIYSKEEMEDFFGSRKIKEFRKIVFVANESRENFCKIYPDLENNTLVINNLVNVEEIKTKSEEKLDIKKKDDDIVFAFVGRLDEHQKRISRLLELFKTLNNRNKKIKLWVIGGGPEYEKALEYIKNNNLEESILLLGMQNNPYKYIKVADYMIIVSDYEGFPVVFNEANILGKLMLSTLDISDDFYKLSDGRGFLISKDIDKCANQIEEILKSNHQTKLIDYNKLNKKRVDKIREVIENEI